MAEFAVGSIAAMASNNPPIQLPGWLPSLGSRLKVLWGFAVYLLVCIAAVHCFGFLCKLAELDSFAEWV